MFVNFFSGVLPTLLESEINDFYIALEGMLLGNSKAFTSNAWAFMVGGSFVALQSILSIAGIAILVYALVKRKIKLQNKPECAIPKGAVGSVVFGNVGTILFLVLSAINVLLYYIPI